MISFIVPVYNSSSSVKKNYESLCALLGGFEFEIIYVNDGSFDNSLELLRCISDIDNRVTVYDQENQGAIYARMTGISLAKFDFISFLDSDDVLTKSFLQDFNKYFLLNCDILTTGFLLVNNFKKKYSRKNNIRAGVYEKDEYLKLVLERSSWELCGKVFKKSLFNNIKMPLKRVSIAEDTFVFIQAVMNVRGLIAVTDTYNYKYIYFPNSISRQKKLNYVEDGLYVGNELKEILRGHIDEVSINSMVLLLYSNSLRRGMISSHNPSFNIVKDSFNLESLMRIPFLKSIFVSVMYFINRWVK